MSLLTLATGLFVELAPQLASRSSRRNSGSQPAKAPGAPSDPPNERTTAPEPYVGTVLYLISFGVVATATAFVFFGISFFLLAHPDMELIAGPSARNGGVEVEPQRADLVPSPDKDAAPSITQTASALSVSPAPPEPHYDVLPPANEGTAPRLEPAGPDEIATIKAAAKPDASQAVRQPQNPQPDELLAITLARPLFSSTRRPPQSASDDAASDKDLADKRLTGIVTEPGHRIAIFTVTGAKPLILTEGETVSGWRIESITPLEVSLSGPGGNMTLQPKLDLNLVAAPKPPPAVASGLVPPPGQPPVPPPAVTAGARPPGVPAAVALSVPNRPLPRNIRGGVPLGSARTGQPQ
jgi:hypothetical protein